VQIVSDLHALLQAAHVSGPYVLAGHSSGGLYARLYASTYPTDVAGMVLVDAAHEDQTQRMPPEAGAGADNPFVLHLHSFLTVVGFARLTGIRFVHRQTLDDPGTRSLANGIKVKTTWPFAYADESFAMEESMTQVRQARRILNIPLVVVTRGRYDALQRLPQEVQDRIKSAWQGMQTDLVGLSPPGAQMVAAGSDHYVHLDQPDVVIDAIRKVVAEARLGTAARAGGF
jgi:pimeloyl-ACP methyl ester carboxylesterase